MAKRGAIHAKSTQLGYTLFAMTIDLSAFTPWSALIGGVVIGLAAALFVLVNGRVTGISGIVGGMLHPRASDIAWRLAARDSGSGP